MSPARLGNDLLFSPRLTLAASLLALTASLAVGPSVALAQSQGPSTSGGSLPYIASGQSEEEVQKRKRARLEAEEKARQAAEAERARQDAAQAPAAEPAPTTVATPASTAPATPPPAVTATTPAAAVTPSVAEPAKPKAATKSRQTAQPREIPPGVSPAVVGSTPEPRVAPPQRSAAPPFPPQPQAGAVVVRRPMFFGLFGPEVGVTERVVVLPPANVGRSQPPPQPAPGTARVAQRKSGSNCHYHAYPTGGMGYAHRDVQCHWHNNPSDSSLRYVD